MSVAVKRLDWSASELRQAAKGLRDATQVRRVLALALVLEGASRTEAATACGMDRQTLRDWVHRYNAEGIDGLIDREAPGRPPRLTPAQEAELKAIVLAGPDLARDGVVRWRRIDLQRVIGERFDVRLYFSPLIDTAGIAIAPFDQQQAIAAVIGDQQGAVSGAGNLAQIAPQLHLF